MTCYGFKCHGHHGGGNTALNQLRAEVSRAATGKSETDQYEEEMANRRPFQLAASFSLASTSSAVML